MGERSSPIVLGRGTKPTPALVLTSKVLTSQVGGGTMEVGVPSSILPATTPRRGQKHHQAMVKNITSATTLVERERDKSSILDSTALAPMIAGRRQPCIFFDRWKYVNI